MYIFYDNCTLLFFESFDLKRRLVSRVTENPISRPRLHNLTRGTGLTTFDSGSPNSALRNSWSSSSSVNSHIVVCIYRTRERTILVRNTCTGCLFVPELFVVEYISFVIFSWLIQPTKISYTRIISELRYNVFIK